MVLKILLSFCFFLTPHFVWGFSFSEDQTAIVDVQSLQKKSKDLRLWMDPQWLALGHYQKKSLKLLSSRYQSKIKGSFFLNSQGWTDPEKELETSIEVLFFKEPLMQCRYLARTAWLKKVLPIPKENWVACPERKDWKHRLHAGQVSLIFASSDMNNAASSFGHTFLKFHDFNNMGSLDVMDYAIDFSARTGTEQGALFALKGLFGFYPGVYGMLPYHQKMKDYIHLEGRDLWEYSLNFQEDEVEKMLDHLLELEGSYVPYYFLDDNCSYQILELIDVVRPELQLSSQVQDAVIPLDSLKWIQKIPGLVKDIKYRPSLMTEWKSSYQELTRSEKFQLKEILSEPLGNHAEIFLSSKSDFKKQDVVSQAKIEESLLRYLSLQEYRLGKDLAEEKYPWILARSGLGKIYQSPSISVPRDPVTSHGSQSLWLGLQKDSEYQAKLEYRRAFHDILSSESGSSPYSHMEVLGFLGSFSLDAGQVNFEKFTFLKMLSTASVNEIERPLSWRFDSGWNHKQKVFLESSLGVSYDFPDPMEGRWILLAEARFDTWKNKINPWVGTRMLWVQKDPILRNSMEQMEWHFVFRGMMEVSYLWPFAFATEQDPWLRWQITATFLRAFQSEGRFKISYDDHPAQGPLENLSNMEKTQWMLMWVRSF